MHVCVDARLWSATGIGTILKNLLPAFLKKKQLILTLLCFPSDQKELTERGFHFLIPMQSSLYSIREQGELPLKIPSCDLFWTPHFNVPIAPIRAKKRMATIHDTYHLTYASKISWLGRLYSQWMYRWAAKKSDVITTISHFSLKEIQNRCFPKAPIELIPLGISSHFKRSLDPQIKTKYQLPDHFILAIGNFKPHKNLPRLLEAFYQLESKWHLVLVGKKETVTQERVLTIPYVSEEDLPAIYSYASALVFPSLYEGFGFPPLEAMACGCPAIVSHVASIPEACGESVEYVNPFSVKSIQEGIKSVLECQSKREKLIAKGYEHVKKFKWETTVERYLKLMTQIIQ